MSWILPESVSTFGSSIDGLYYVILVITGAVFLLTEATLIWFLIRYRHREGRRAEYVHGNLSAEVIWTLIPFVIVLGLALGSKSVWDTVRDPANIPEGALDLLVEAKQFEWNTTYPGPDGVLDSDDDYTLRNQMHIPVGRAVRILLTSEDVIHSFFIPDFRVKQDAVPGLETVVWFEATEPGEYALGCAELCGIGHYRMRGRVVAHGEEDFEAWEDEQMAGAVNPRQTASRSTESEDR